MTISLGNVVRVDFNSTEVKACQDQARTLEFGGVSFSRKSPGERQATLREDQVVGQLGELALFVWAYGKSRGLQEYLKTQESKRGRGHRGDGGQDILGHKVDIKSSLVRNNKDIFTYNLLVASREFHPGWWFVQGLVWEYIPDVSATVAVMGWAKAENLLKPGVNPRFDCWTLSTRNLFPMSSLRLVETRIAA